jgi:hypothetical protein
VVAATVKRIGRLAIPALVDGLRLPNPDARAHAATLLAKIAPDDEMVASALKCAADDRDDDVRRTVRDALTLVETPLPSYAGV